MRVTPKKIFALSPSAWVGNPESGFPTAPVRRMPTAADLEGELVHAIGGNSQLIAAVGLQDAPKGIDPAADLEVVVLGLGRPHRCRR